jgi:hypothetical protein
VDKGGWLGGSPLSIYIQSNYFTDFLLTKFLQLLSISLTFTPKKNLNSELEWYEHYRKILCAHRTRSFSLAVLSIRHARMDFGLKGWGWCRVCNFMRTDYPFRRTGFGGARRFKVRVQTAFLFSYFLTRLNLLKACHHTVGPCKTSLLEPTYIHIHRDIPVQAF